MHFLSTVLAASCIFAPAFAASATWQYMEMFSNHTGAVRASDYQTYTLVDSVQDCMDFCDSVEGCLFINRRSSVHPLTRLSNFWLIAFHDVNGKDGSPDFTCSVFAGCHTADDATNTGGQTQPDGTIDSIADSSGFCKTNVTVTEPDA
ncbi:hypothetical protein IW262DRAFT_1431518 [Armillaria fumosa]|nr:hypothetical protein IW262DRAFT_1431518 [Armillaria fumosa]